LFQNCRGLSPWQRPIVPAHPSRVFNCRPFKGQNPGAKPGTQKLPVCGVTDSGGFRGQPYGCLCETQFHRPLMFRVKIINMKKQVAMGFRFETQFNAFTSANAFCLLVSALSGFAEGRQLHPAILRLRPASINGTGAHRRPPLRAPSGQYDSPAGTGDLHRHQPAAAPTPAAHNGRGRSRCL